MQEWDGPRARRDGAELASQRRTVRNWDGGEEAAGPGRMPERLYERRLGTEPGLLEEVSKFYIMCLVNNLLTSSHSS